MGERIQCTHLHEMSNPICFTFLISIRFNIIDLEKKMLQNNCTHVCQMSASVLEESIRLLQRLVTN